MVGIRYCPLTGAECNKFIEVQEDTFFLAEPFDRNRKKRERAVKNALKEALDDRFSENSLKIADKEARDTSIFCDICCMIQSCMYGIADISDLNPNVLIELGMMLALGKPVFILVKKSEEEKLREKNPIRFDLEEGSSV